MTERTVGVWQGTDRDFLELLTKIVFRTGFSRSVVERRWPAFHEAFQKFELEAVAAFDEALMESLVNRDSAIVRNLRKVKATAVNARICLALRGEHGSLAGFVLHVAELGEAAGRRLLARTFCMVGDSAAASLWTALCAEPFL